MKRVQFKFMSITVFLISFINVCAQSVPYELVSGYDYERLYNTNVPNANYSDQFGIFDFETIGDNIYFGMAGAHPYGSGNAWTTITQGVLGKINNVGTPQIIKVLDDEGFLHVKRLGDELIINGSDATDYVADFRVGFNYTYSETDGLKKYGEKHSFRKIKETTTDANGNYSFSKLPSDYYFVRFVRPANFELSPKISDGPCFAPVWNVGSTWVRRDWEEQSDSMNNDAEYKTDPLFNGYKGSFPGAYVEVSGPSAGTAFPYVNNNIDCGLVPALGAIGDIPNDSIIEFPSIESETVIGGKVWSDTNGDGYMDTGELGEAGVKVEIYSYGYYFPNVIHSFGVYIDEENGDAYIPMGTNSNTAPIYKYAQSNKEWSLAGSVHNANRSWHLSKLDGIWYTKNGSTASSTACSPIPTSTQGVGTYYSTDLYNWSLLSRSFDGNAQYSFVPYRNRLIHRKQSNSIESIQNDQTLEEHILPNEIANFGFNAITTISNEYVYLGTDSGAVYRSADLATWSYMGTTHHPIYSLHYWEEKNALLIGTGESSNGKIYRMDDVGGQFFQCGTDFEAFSLYVEKQGDQYSLSWDQLSAGSYTIKIFNHNTGLWSSIKTTENSYTYHRSSFSGDAPQFDFVIEAECTSTRQIYKTATISKGDNCCQLSCEPFDFTTHWNILNEANADFNWSSISGSSSYQIYWSANNNDWNLLSEILPSSNYFDGDDMRTFIENSKYDSLHFKVRAVCSSGSFYDSVSNVLSIASSTANKELYDTNTTGASIENLFRLSPNPVNEIATMTILENMEQYTIDVFTISGQKVYHFNGVKKTNNNQVELNLSHLNSGIFLISLRSMEHMEIEKICIK